MKAYIGLDTSCYTASAAAVLEDGRIAADFREALPVPDGTIGLRQSEAVFVHLRTMPALLEAVFQQIRQHEAAAVCASIKPRPVEGSYMPVFIVGKSMARSVAASLGVPYFETTHQEGHIAAGLLGQVEMPEEFLALHVSGGTTEVLQVRQKEAGYDISLLGGTKDISAGQLVDRIGVLIGCRFPAGGEMEGLAQRTGAASISVPVSVDGMDCSFSGTENRLKISAAEGADTGAVCRAVFACISGTLSKMIQAASKKTGLKDALLAGGVMQNQMIRDALAEDIQRKAPDIRLRLCPKELSGDNAAGVAALCRKMYESRGANP